jgi:hypothetical protein
MRDFRIDPGLKEERVTLFTTLLIPTSFTEYSLEIQIRRIIKN